MQLIMLKLCRQQNGHFGLTIDGLRRFRYQHRSLQHVSRVFGAPWFCAQVLISVTGNHTAYKQVKGTKTSPEEILELYEGLRQSNLNNFNVLSTGYMPSAACVQAIGKIGRDIKFNAGTKPGSFFWGELWSHEPSFP
jgi:hypothetical protein